MFLGLFVLLLLCWLAAFVVLHVTSGLIHILLILAVFSLIWHLVRPRTAA